MILKDPLVVIVEHNRGTGLFNGRLLESVIELLKTRRVNTCYFSPDNHFDHPKDEVAEMVTRGQGMHEYRDLKSMFNQSAGRSFEEVQAVILDGNAPLGDDLKKNGYVFLKQLFPALKFAIVAYSPSHYEEPLAFDHEAATA